METQDLLVLREHYNRQRIMLCFNGPISRSLIEEIGNALRNYLTAEQAQPSAAMDVFAVYIEMTQNIRHYATSKNLSDSQASGTITISREQDHYIINAGNVVDIADGEALLQRIHHLAGLDKTGLKALWKTQMRQPRQAGASSGAGLGLIDMARKASQPLAASFNRLDDHSGFFSLQVVL